MLNQMKKYGVQLLTAAVSMGVLTSAQAAGSYDAITSAVSMTDVATAIVAIFALLAVAGVAFKGGKWVLKAIGGGA